MKKNFKKAAPNALATGVFKKRKWPWLLVLAGALCPLYPLAILAKEFFITKCPYCETFVQHIAPNFPLLAKAALIFAVALVVAILFMVFPKRSLVVTACKVTYKKGRKTTPIPFSAIDRIDVRGRHGIIVRVSTEKFKFKKLKNRKEIYDAILLGIQTNAKMMTEVDGIAVESTQESTLTKLTESKIRYFKTLLDKGSIDEKQFAAYVETALETQ